VNSVKNDLTGKSDDLLIKRQKKTSSLKKGTTSRVTILIRGKFRALTSANDSNTAD